MASLHIRLSLACMIFVSAAPAWAANIIHEFYVPMPDAQIRTALVSIEPAAGIVGTTMESVVSIVVTGAGSVVHYDEWEDGYEVDINNPSQPTTKIWGDGNNANGVPPGYANDPASLSSGAVINLRNQITLPRNPATILYDGRDRFGGTKALVVTRTGWAVAPGTVLAGSVEVTATMDYGTNYIVPVGQDVSAASMFEVAGLMVMARENGTSVTVDINGPAGGGSTTFTLNQGESYLVSSGVLKGATVSSSKPVQAQLITGDIGARYETDWFTLYPVDQWSSTYYSPVGTAIDGDQTYGFFYNPTGSPLTINTLSALGTGSFSIPADGVYQYQMPQNSGSKFTSAGDVPFFGIVMVGANPTANNVHDWGFTLVPSDSLTTEAVVGWGPGSSDLSQNGSPVWVTPDADTRIYVDYNGDRNGPNTDPKGNKYDVHYDLTALTTKLLFDPDKDQSAMRIYTLDGVQITAAWGQDPASAGPGNPFLDVGTTVLPFPVPTLIKSVVIITDTAPTGFSIGDTIEYSIDVDNKGLLPLGNLLVLDPLNPSLTYVPNSTKRDGTAIADGSSGTPFPLDESGYIIPIILRGGTTNFTYRCTINAAGSINNTASNSTYNLTSTTEVNVPPGGGSTACGAVFTNSSGTTQTSYSAGALIYATMTDPDANNDSGVAETITVVINNTSNADAEFVTLTETGVNTGIFRNTVGLTTSLSSGTNQMDGTLFVAPGNNLSFTYVDPEFNETCSGAATISVPTQNKYLYLDTDGTDGDTAGDLDRVDPVATSDGTTSSSTALSYTTVTNHASNPNAAIPENNSAGVTNDLTISGQGSITDLDIELNITHTYVGDLIVTITHVDTGTSATIVDRPGKPASNFGCSGNNILAIIDDAASQPVENQCAGAVPTISGTFSPNNPLSVFNGESLNGTWRIKVSDNANSDIGTLVSWQLDATQSSGGNSSATFTQTPSFASTFTMPSGSTPGVTAYYTVSSGTMPGTPSITAALRKNGTTFATSTSASASGGLLTFTFGSLGVAQNFAATDVMSLLVTTAQSGVTFTLDYDSSTKPSKITLPTTTVINVDSLGVYDAPYPGGSLITGPASGTTVYIRSTASDPFGAYDISSMGLSVDGPGAGGDVTTTLGSGQVVNTGTGTKTYEYPWVVGSTTGTYNIVVTAQEGTEGIQSQRATSVNVTFLDLGTPSLTEFTTGLNGPGTPTYAGNEQVCVRVTDLDQNLSATTIETIQATITSLVGDSELVTLTETGVNTGIFVYCIPASTSASNTPNDGTLHAVLGDVLTVNYVDPTDPTDTGSDTATIPNIAPAVSVNKTLVTPADGIAIIGEAISYQVQVINTGNTTLSTVSLVDTFPAADLTYISASTAPNTVASGSLTWNNVGPLTQGQSVTLTVNFTALSTAAPATNTATADAGGGVTGGDTADVTITDPKITIAKTLLNPNPGPANINDNVTFRIVVTNTGDTAIATLPIEDTYSGADFEFVSATVGPDATGSGSLLWLDVTGAGTLTPTNAITIDVVLKAKGAAAPANNLAKAEYTVDVNGDSAPPVSSSASITLIAAKITGHVYDDVNQNGAYNPPGDAPLESITVSLYSDPNGDGNPADGTLLDITLTDVNGAYEFGNLPTGNYVIVESQPPGYSSHSDTAGANDNRIPLVISTLTTFANNDFFDFLTPPVSYASIAGKVWNDANASATVNGGEVGIENVGVDLVEDTNNNAVADPGEPIVASTLTAPDGTYGFGGLSAGNYVVVEHDLFGWYSTADSSGANDNQVPVTLSAGQNATSKDFLDVLTGTTGGKVFHDVNGNGGFDGGDIALANIDVLITDSLGATQTVVTDSNGDWTATVPPGTTTIDVQQSDPQFTAVFATGYTQTAGTDPNTITAVSGVNTAGGDDGFRRIGTITGHAYIDTNGDGDQDPGEPNLANVDVIITNVDGVPQTVTTNASGNWTATVPPGLTTVNIDNTDPQFTALVLAGFIQTDGADPSTVTAVADTTTPAGNDGFFNPATIIGTVVADTDNDDVGDAPIAGVTVTLKDGSGNDIDSDAGTPGVQPTTALTDSNGEYTFDGLPPGNYRVVQTQPFLYQSVSDLDGGDHNVIGDVTLIALGAGQTAGGNDFVEEATGAITGSVFDDTGDDDTLNGAGESPMPGVIVRLYRDVNGNGQQDGGDFLISTTATDLNGEYWFTGLPPGEYVVVETQPLGYTSSDDDAQGSGTDNTIAVALTTSSSADNDFLDDGGALYQIITNVFNDIADDDTLNGTGEAGITGVTVALYVDVNNNGVHDAGDLLVSTALTDGQGQICFHSVPPGSYVLVETDPTGATSDDDTDGSNTDNMIGLDVVNTDLVDNDFLDDAPVASISGTVLNDTNDDDTLNGAGETPIPGVIVSLYSDPNGDGDPSDGFVIATTATNASGVYTFENVVAGNYVVVETQPSGFTASDDDASGSPADNRVPVTLAAGVPSAGNDFLDDGGEVYDVTGQAYHDYPSDGELNGSNEVPMQGVTITLYADINGDGLLDGYDVLIGSTTTNSSGLYTFADLAPGDYIVVETDPAGATSLDDVEGDPADNTVVVAITNSDSTGNDFLDYNPDQPGSISGKVWADTNNDDVGDSGIGGVVLTLLDSSGAIIDGDTGAPGVQPITATTNASGEYTFINVPPGSYQVSEAQPAGYASVSDADGGNPNIVGDQSLIVLDAGESETGKDFIEEQYGSISGTVWADTDNDDAGEAGIEGVSVALWTDPNGDGNPADGTQVGASADTDADGEYIFANVLPGNYVVVESQPAGYLDVTDGDTTTPGDDAANTSATDNAIPVSIAAGESDDGNNFIEEQPGTISGTVTALAPMTGVTITLFSDPNGDGDPTDGLQIGSGVLTGAGGIYSFTNVPPGDYVVVESQPAGWVTVSDADTTNASDDTADTGADNRIPVSITAGETDNGNNFVEGCPTINVNPETLPNGTAGTAYSQTLSASGGTAPYTFAVTTGSLPAGLSLSGATISGTPSSPDSETFTITATDSNGCAGTREYTIVTTCPVITVSPASLPGATVGTAYSQTISASGGTAPYSFAVTTGALPTGLTLTGGGLLSGTPTAAGTFNFTITATDDYGCTGQRALSIVATCPPITVSPSSLPGATVGTAYSQTISATGGTAPYSFAVTSGTLPAGLALSGGGALSGTPTAAGTFNFTITATDANGCTGERALSIVATCPVITVNPASLPGATVGTAYSQTISATDGTAPYSFAVTTGALPTGLTLSGGGLLSGTPTAAGTSNFTITATDANGCTGERALSITSTCPTITVSPASLPDATVGSAYSQTLSSTGGTSPYTYAVTGGSLPDGLALSGATISGTPTVAGTANFTITATDANGCAGQSALSITSTCPTITLSSTPDPLPNGSTGTPYSATISASGGSAPYTFALKAGSALPAGLNLSSAGAITGTPTTSGGTSFIVVATDANSCDDEATFTISVSCPTITVTPGSLSDGVVGTSYGPVTFSQTGGVGTITWALSGSLPAGMSFNAGTATLGGTPTATGTFNVTVSATDANGCIGSVNLSFSTSCPAIDVTPDTLPDGVVGTAYSQTLGASGGTPPYTYAVTSGTLPAGLSLSGATISGTPAAAGTSGFTITATDANGCEGTQVLSITMTCPAILVNPASLPDGVVGTSYSQTLNATGGTAPYAFAITSGSLPTGLALSGATISGTPTAAGTFNFTVTATDANNCAGQQAFTVTATCPAISVTPPSLPDATIGSFYSQTLSASGGTAPYTYAVTTGALPSGLTLVSGVISGTPDTAGTASFTITATDAHGCTGERALSITTSCPAIDVTPDTLPDGTAGTAYSRTITATGGTAPYVFTHTGTLPAGLSLSTGGLLSGTPTAAGTFNFTVTAEDDYGCTGTQALSITITCPAITLNPAALPPATVGTPYSVTFSASGGTAPYSYALTGTLPAGLSFAVDSITGTPTSDTGATFTITATDANGCEGGLEHTLTPVCPTITLSSMPAPLPSGTVGMSYSGTVSASGGSTPYSFAVKAGSSLPPGLALSGTGAITGTPTANGATNTIIVATDAHGCSAEATFTINVGCNTLLITPSSLGNGTVGTAYGPVEFNATGGTGVLVWQLTGALPAGMSFNAGTATLSGTPTEEGTFNVVISVTDENSCGGSVNLSFSTSCPAIDVTPGTLPDGVVGMAYSQTLGATGGTAPYTYAVTSGTLPAGLSLSGATISGTPTAAGTANFAITATDANGCEGSQALSITTTCPAITVSPGALPDGVLGTAYSQTLGASGGTAPYTYAVTAGALPAGLGLSGNTISGTPTVAGEFNFTITATDAHGCTGSQALSITTSCPVIDVTPDTLPGGTAGTAYSQTLTATGGTAPYVFTHTGTLPTGLSLSTAGLLSGTPTAAGTFNFTVTAEDDHGCTGTQALTITITCPAITVNPATLPDASLGAPYSQALSSSGGTAPYTYAVTAGTLPGGLSLTGDTISGTPTAAGTFNFTITATDDNDCEGSSSLSIVVAAGSISNLVWVDADNDGLKDGSESGLDGVVIELLDGSGNPIDSDPLAGGVQPTETTTAGGGLYSFANIPPGSYQLRIAAPPASHPISSSVTDTNDNGEDDDDNGSQSVAGGAITSPVITLSAGESDATLDFGLVAPASIGSLVWHDTDNDGLKDGSEAGIDNVTVALLDSLSNPVDDPHQAGVQPYLVTTSGGGLYIFTDLVPGSYIVRISSPPASYPMSSTPTNTSDDGVDDDDNGTQATPSATVTSPVIVLAHGESDGTKDFGFTAISGLYSISGQVRDDYDVDGEFSDLDQPVPNVNVNLYADTNGNGSFDPGTDELIDTTTTDGLGEYLFTGLPDGTYFVEEQDPNPSDSTADTDGPNDNLIEVVISGEDSTGNDFLDAVDPAGYIYHSVTGQIIAGGTVSVTGPGTITVILDGTTGQYSFISDTGGTFTLAYTPPAGYIIDPLRPVAGPSFDPTGLTPDPYALGSDEDSGNPGYLENHTSGGNPYYLTFELAPGDPFVINNNIPLVESKPSTFVAWQYSNPLGGQNGATDDPDGDGFTNLEEFAFCFTPQSGVSGECPLEIVLNGDGTLDAKLRRLTSYSGLTYTLEYIADLAASGASGAGWTDLTTILPTSVNNGDGTTTSTYANLAQVPALSTGRGFVRVKVTDTGSGATARTYAAGWGTRALPAGCQTCAAPFLKCALFTGKVDSVIGSVLGVSSSAGTGDFTTAFSATKHYYIEVTAGDNAGHRFEVNEGASTATNLVLDGTSARNTQASIPASLANDFIVLREHLTIGEAYPPSSFTATNNPATADRMIFFNRGTGSFEVYWLFLAAGTPRWVLTGDAGLLSQNDRVLDPCEGHFIHPRNNATSVTFTGEIRENAFACPILPGTNFFAGGWPVDQSPNQRGMTVAGGFSGTANPATSDRVLFWNGDTTPGAESYQSHFLLNAGARQQWTPQSDASLLNENNLPLFDDLRSAILRASGGVNWIMPLGWTP